ncbi:MAG: glycine--tRNA ligase subunit beta [Thermodesulfobacteriota bacterium]
MTNDLLLEISCEEIPAGYIGPALLAMQRLIGERLGQTRISFGGSRVYGTPRRLAVIVSDVADRQPDEKVQMQGPPARVAFDEAGNPTMAGRKFAEKAGVDASALFMVETDKGSYVAAVKEEKGRPVVEVLSEILPEVITALPFPKSMRWADLPLSFARPVTGFTALYGSQVIPFTLNKIASGNETFGHFFSNPGKILVENPGTYLEVLRAAHVVADIEERKAKIREGIRKAAAGLGGKVREDEDLLAIVTNLVENPAVVAGSFEAGYLEVPPEILITAMAKHQKYFAVETGQGALAPHFIAVNNTAVSDPALSVRGHERVLRARLEDARFFFRADLSGSMDDWAEKLSGVMFQAKLGSVKDKTARIATLADFLAKALGLNRESAVRAARLCKADLVSHVVGEFPELQGIMGRIYAGRAGEPEEVCRAIEEHYRPVQAGGALPETDAGSLVALSDKLDTLCGCFSVGLAPTGASDPYALRRATIGVLQILSTRGISLPLSQMVDKALSLLPERPAPKPAPGKKERPDKGLSPEEAKQKVLAFCRDRLSHILTEAGHAKDTAAAILAAGSDDVPWAFRRAEGLSELRKRKDYEAVAVTFKRVSNIIRQAAEKGLLPPSVSPDPALFENACEKELLDALQESRRNVEALVEKRDAQSAILAAADLRPRVDAFFEGVMVMAENEGVRANRLCLLREISDLFAGLADFSKVSA